MANPQSPTDHTNTTDVALTYTGSGRILHISLPFMNDLITVLTTLSSSFEEDLARISYEQREAEQTYVHVLEYANTIFFFNLGVDKEAPKEKALLVVSVELEEYLRETMWKLCNKEEDKYDELVAKYPGTGAIAKMADPRESEAAILALVTNKY